MKTKFVLASVFAAVSGLAGAANTATAGLDVHLNAIFAGRPATPIVAPAYCAPSAPVIVERVRHDEPRGYWRDVVVKTWVPARWVVSRNFFGAEHRRLEAGYFTYRTERVWENYGHGYARG